MRNLGVGTWSESYWTVMESIVIRCDEPMEERWKESVKSVFEIMGEIIPCEKCREHYKKYMRECPIQDYVISQVKLYYWLYNLRRSMGFRYDEKEYVIYIYDKFKQGGWTELYFKIQRNSHLKRE